MNKILTKEELQKIVALKMPNDDDYNGTPARYSPIETIIIPEGYVEIEENLFEKVYGLKSINLPSTLKIINAFAFNNCRDLKRVNCFSNIVDVKIGAFRSCFNMREINMNMAIKNIENVFNGISIPKKLRSYKLAFDMQGEIYTQTYISQQSMSQDIHYQNDANNLQKAFVVTEPFKQ